jgi:excisionase family DNA binding protein
MKDTPKLLNLKEVSHLLKVNTEVLRRWLRSGKLNGIKVGSDWRVSSAELASFLRAAATTEPEVAKKPSNQNELAMCIRFPKWLEFSGLPYFFNETYGPEAWPIFKKLVELDFEAGKPSHRKIKYNLSTLSEQVGYDEDMVQNILKTLVKAGYISLSKSKLDSFFSIVSPIRTPKLILDIDYANGGVKGAPESALNNTCLRRFLEY